MMGLLIAGVVGIAAGWILAGVRVHGKGYDILLDIAAAALVFRRDAIEDDGGIHVDRRAYEDLQEALDRLTEWMGGDPAAGGREVER